MKIAQLIQAASGRFPDADCAVLDAEIIIAHGLGKTRSWLKAFADETLTSQQLAELHALLERRVQGEPVAYILGEWEFYSLPLSVTPATLIPRPETEALVDFALATLAPLTAPKILDLGTGSGAIALALKSQRADAAVTAFDVSEEALAVAKQNAADLNLNVEFACSDWFSALSHDQRFDLIISNPPYVAEDDPHMQQGDLRYEPITALTAGADEYADLKTIIERAKAFLNPAAWVMVEHGYYQGETVRQYFTEQGYQAVSTQLDLAGQPRFSCGQRVE
ncbi:MAG: peptide chain release factor N(5)-glutamine methyltransferase [Gammaproteobacteria bacterium]|nr:peptide chain release factor N(5)-glutamine methyltransferase [Gammaproteobacteria bacterium]NVK88654.1 peptide chain release factor N(5)-glutamine methyltransferase [Gammaproteobacteria bacterium]